MTETTKPNGIHAAVLKAQRMCAEKGIAKDSTANMNGSTIAFRGVEAALNTLSEILTVCEITHTPRTLSCEVQHLARAEAGKFIRIAVVKCEFKFEHADGSFHLAETYGEGSDFNDKAITKAQSVALRTALFNKFLVPTAATSFDPEQDDDTPIDGNPAEVRDRSESQAPPPASPRGELPDYPKADFENNFPNWSAMVGQGKTTPQAIIAKLATVGRLNPTQKAKLNALKRAE
jgi:hypothetical protein